MSDILKKISDYSKSHDHSLGYYYDSISASNSASSSCRSPYRRSGYSGRPQGIQKLNRRKIRNCNWADPRSYNYKRRQQLEGYFSSSQDKDIEDDQYTSNSTSSEPCDSYEELHYTELLHDIRQDRLSSILNDPQVQRDSWKRKSHVGNTAAFQFDFKKGYIRNMLRHMYERFDCVSVYSLAMLEPGDIIYYLSPYVLGLHQKDSGYYVKQVGPSNCTARMKMKGRFGIVVAKYKRVVKVAEMTTFNRQGLAAALTQDMWDEYCGIREFDSKTNYYHPSMPKRQPLEVRSSVCEIHEMTSVHLVTNQINECNQIMIAGRLVNASLEKLREMIQDTEDGASC